MATEKQLQSNGRNAKRSTGPRSPEGKARSRLNSRKHGLTAKTLIIVGECADDFDQLRSDLMDGYDPQSALECELVERLVGILWRLRRVPSFEAAILDARHQQVWNQTNYLPEPEDHEKKREADEEEADWETSVDLGVALMEGRYGDALGKIGRYETTLMNAFTKTLQTLLLLQHDRANGNAEKAKLELIALPLRPDSSGAERT